MRGWMTVCLALAAMMLTACALPKAPDGAEAAADKAFTQLTAGDIAGLQKWGTPEMQGPVVAAQAERLRRLLPTTRSTSNRTIQWQLNVDFKGPEQLQIEREYEYPDHTVQWFARLSRNAKTEPWKLYGCNAQVATHEQLRVTAFTLQGRSLLHYAVLVGAILSPLICLVALVWVIRAPKFPWKWAFAILSVLAFARFSLNWTTGEGVFQPINVTLLGVGLLKQGGAFAPWVLSVAAPLGALVGFWRGWKARRDHHLAVKAAFR